MSFATREEIVRFLTDLDSAPAVGRGDLLRQMLPRIRDDAVHAELRARLEKIE